MRRNASFRVFRFWLPLACCVAVPAIAAFAQRAIPPGAAPGAPGGWGYGGGPEQTRYSRLTQINRSTVKQLEVAWTYDTGEPGAMQTQPIVVGDVLYGYTPTHKAFAANAATGAPLWTFDSGIGGSGPNRGLMFWSEGTERRVFAAVGNFIYALDPATGK